MPDNFGLYQGQAQTNVGLAAFLAAVVVFFVGLLISSFSQYDLTIKFPIAFLIISTFGFLYAALIYANGASAVSHRNELQFKRHMFLGDVISEYLGVYFLVTSIPLVINVITFDSFLRIITAASALVGLAVYQFSNVSLMERHFRRSRPIAILVLLAELILFLSQIYQIYFAYVATAILLLFVLITFLVIRTKDIDKLEIA